MIADRLIREEQDLEYELTLQEDRRQVLCPSICVSNLIIINKSKGGIGTRERIGEGTEGGNVAY